VLDDDDPIGMPEGLSRLVVGYDGSSSADAAAAFALWLTRKARCATTLVHVTVSPSAAPSADVLLAAADQIAADRKEWKRRLDNLREYASPEAAVDCRVVSGSAAGALIEVANETAADLVMVGSHGVGRVRGALLGSVSSQVLSHAPCSVMIFGEHARSVPAARARAVVVGIDGSPASRRALQLAESIASALTAGLVLVHARDAHTTASRDGPRAMLQDGRSSIAAAVAGIEEELVEGDPRDALVAACERHAPALLVVGRRGHGGFKGLLLGSTSRTLANRAPCPVVVFHASG